MFPQPSSEKDGLCVGLGSWKASQSCIIPAQDLLKEMQWWPWARWSSSVWHGNISLVPYALLFLLPSAQVVPIFLVSHHFLCLLVNWKALAFGSICLFSPSLANKVLSQNPQVHSPKYCLSLPILSLGPWLSLLCSLPSPAMPYSEIIAESILSSAQKQ